MLRCREPRQCINTHRVPDMHMHMRMHMHMHDRRGTTTPTQHSQGAGQHACHRHIGPAQTDKPDAMSTLHAVHPCLVMCSPLAPLHTNNLYHIHVGTLATHRYVVPLYLHIAPIHMPYFTSAKTTTATTTSTSTSTTSTSTTTATPIPLIDHLYKHIEHTLRACVAEGQATG